MEISIIIPVLNERDNLPATLTAISEVEQSNDRVKEIIVVDGGSTDGTQEWLAGRQGLCFVESAGGRGLQLRAGVQKATGEVLLFLHGDCLLPSNAVRLMARELSDKQVTGGCFLIAFPESSAWSLRLIAKGINGRTLMTRTGTGDQAIFVRREIYESLGGFKAWPLFEDVDLVTRMKRRGRFIVLHTCVTISPRRWIAHGPWRTTLLMYGLRIGYWLGISPIKLKEWFVDVRQ